MKNIINSINGSNLVTVMLGSICVASAIDLVQAWNKILVVPAVKGIVLALVG